MCHDVKKQKAKHTVQAFITHRLEMEQLTKQHLEKSHENEANQSSTQLLLNKIEQLHLKQDNQEREVVKLRNENLEIRKVSMEKTEELKESKKLISSLTDRVNTLERNLTETTNQLDVYHQAMKSQENCQTCSQCHSIVKQQANNQDNRENFQSTSQELAEEINNSYETEPSQQEESASPGPQNNAIEESASPGPQNNVIEESASPGPQNNAIEESTSPGPQNNAIEESTSPGPQNNAIEESTSPGPQNNAIEESTSPGPQNNATEESTSPGLQNNAISQSHIETLGGSVDESATYNHCIFHNGPTYCPNCSYQLIKRK